METKKKIPLPLLILIISAAIGLVFCGIGGIRQMNAKRTNEKNRQEAEKQVKKNQKILEEKYDELKKELETAKKERDTKSNECDSIVVGSEGWSQNKSKCSREKYDLDVKVMNIESQMTEIEMYDNTVTYPLVKPMTYLIFYIIGGAIFGLGALGAFIIYLVKGKKTY